MIKNIYDIMREKAKEMNHAAAKYPNLIWEKYTDMNDNRVVLRSAKLYMENYMMGELDPADFAHMMAENDRLRYTISDLCRMRLEPVTPDIQRNQGFLDFGAGIKTFWTEIRVPLPSELNTARDLRNISLGIEAARSVDGKTKPLEKAEQLNNGENTGSQRRSIRDILKDVRKHAAEKAIEKLTPIAENDNLKKYDEEWLKTEDGQVYRNQLTKLTATEVENIVMDIEAGKDGHLDPENRRKAFEAAGISDNRIEKTVEENIKSIEDKAVSEWENNGKFENEPLPISQIESMENTDSALNTADYYINLYKLHILQENGVETPGSEPVTNEKLKEWRDLLAWEQEEDMRAQRDSEIKSIETELEVEWEQNGRFEKEPLSVTDMKNLPSPVPTEDFYRNLYKLYIKQQNGVETPGAEPVTNEMLKEWKNLFIWEQEQDIHMQESGPDMKKDSDLKSGYTREELNSSLNDDMKMLFDQIAQHVDKDKGYRRHKDYNPDNQDKGFRKHRNYNPETKPEPRKEQTETKPVFDQSDEDLMNYYMGGGNSHESSGSQNVELSSEDLHNLFNDDNGMSM